MKFTEDQLQQFDFQVRELDSYSAKELYVLLHAVTAQFLVTRHPEEEKNILDVWMYRIRDAYKEAKGREEELPFE